MELWTVARELEGFSSRIDALWRAYDFARAGREHPQAQRVGVARQTVSNIDKAVDECGCLIAALRDQARDGASSSVDERHARQVIAELGLRVLDVCIVVRTWPLLAAAITDWPDLQGAVVHLADPESPYWRAWHLAVAYLGQECDWLSNASAELSATAGPDMALVPAGIPSVGTARGLELFCRVTGVALGLIEAAVRDLLREWRRPAWAQQAWDDDDKPRTEADMAARRLWQSGEMWIESGKAFGKGNGQDGAVHGSGHWAEMVRATVGHDAKKHAQALMSADPRIFGVKRRARTRDFYRPPTKDPDYSRVFPKEAVHRLYDAVAFANRCGVVLNARVTVSWFLLSDCSAAECDQLFQRFKKNLGQWLIEKGPPEAGQSWPSYVYAHEAAGSTKYHTHMRLAVPPLLAGAFESEVSKALQGVIKPRRLPEPTLNADGKRTGKFVVVRVSRLQQYDPNRHRPRTEDQWITVRYMLKGVDPRPVLTERRDDGRPVVVVTGDILEWEYEDPGAPWAGKRFAASQALGPAARKNFRDARGEGFQSLLEQQIKEGTLDVRLLYSDWYLDRAEGRGATHRPPLVNPDSPDPDDLLRLI